MSTPPSLPKRRRKLLVTIAVAVVATLVVIYRGHVGCYLFYAECNPLLSVPEMPGWNVPTNPHEKAMYDLAHSLKVPDGVAQPVPFDFKAARLKDLYGDKSVEQQYFEHLCATEASEYVFRRIENVDGFQILRPRGFTVDTPEDADRYGVEEPTGFGWLGDDNQFDFLGNSVAEQYVQPLTGIYDYVEMVDTKRGGALVRVERSDSVQTKGGYPLAQDSNWAPMWLGSIRVPNLMSHRDVDQLNARYGYIWRGLRRSRDREFGIGGGEFFVIDLTSNEVLGMRRDFNSTFSPRHPGFTKWSAARGCLPLKQSKPIVHFINKVLNVDVQVNDEILREAVHWKDIELGLEPSSYPRVHAEYHRYLEQRMGK